MKNVTHPKSGGPGRESESDMRACVLLALLLLLVGEGDSLEPRSDHGNKCRNSIQGRSHLLDDQGWLCELGQVDWETGCCEAGRAAEERYSCRTCEDETKCCEVPLCSLCMRAAVARC